MFAADREIRNHAFSIMGATQPLSGFLGALAGGGLDEAFLLAIESTGANVLITGITAKSDL